MGEELQKLLDRVNNKIAGNTSDLIERLRAEAEGMPTTYIKHQAADELEQKDAEIAALVILVKGQDQRIAELEADKQDLRDKCAAQIDNVHGYMKELQAENKRLRDAIRENGKEFGKYGDHVRQAGCYALAESDDV